MISFSIINKKINPLLQRMIKSYYGLGLVLFRLSKMRSRYIEFISKKTPERLIENEFVLENLVYNKGRILDVGTCDSFLSFELIRKGFRVYGLDINRCQTSNKMLFIQHDIRTLNFPSNYFDQIIAVSTLEHVGLSGRYGVSEEDTTGDKSALKNMSRMLKPNGQIIISVPFGIARIVRPYHRIYGSTELRELIGENLKIDYLEFHIPFLKPTRTYESKAVKVDAPYPHQQYALAIAILRKPFSNS